MFSKEAPFLYGSILQVPASTSSGSAFLAMLAKRWYFLLGHNVITLIKEIWLQVLSRTGKYWACTSDRTQFNNGQQKRSSVVSSKQTRAQECMRSRETIRSRSLFSKLAMLHVRFSCSVLGVITEWRNLLLKPLFPEPDIDVCIARIDGQCYSRSCYGKKLPAEDDNFPPPCIACTLVVNLLVQEASSII